MRKKQKKNFLANKFLVSFLALVVLVSLGARLTHANTNEDSLLDKIMYQYLQLKGGLQSQVGDFGESLGAAGNLLAENYINYVRQNTGYNSAYSITTTDTLTGADLSVTDDATITDALTVSGATSVETFKYGGGVTASSTANSTATLLAAYFDVEDTIDFTPTNQDVTLTLPATSTLTTFIASAQDKGTFLIKNATTTAGIQITISAGTGINFNVASTSATVFLNPQDYAKFECRRKANTDIDCLVATFDDR